MNNTVSSVVAPKPGLCPHGLPPSACPICSNMGGGGSKKVEISFKSKPLPMMSWNQCEAIGFFLKAQRRAVENRHEMFKQLAINLLSQADKFAKMSARLVELATNFAQYPMGNIIALPIKFILLPAVRILQSTFNKLADISDKIVAIIGELKKGLERAKENLNKFAKEIKNKFFKLFSLFGSSKTNDDDKQIDEEKKIFNIKNIMKLIKRKRSHET